MKSLNTKFIKITGSIIAIALISSIFSACSEKETVKSQEIKNVKVLEASRTDMVVNVDYAGKTKADEEVTVSPKIPGKVLSVNVDVGSEVQKGEILFTIEDSSAKVQLKQSQAAVDSAKANLTRTKDSSLSQQELQAKTAVDSAQLQYDEVKKLYDQTHSLYKGGKVTKQQLDDVELKLKGAELQLKTAQEGLDILHKKAGPQSVEVVSKQVDQAQAAYELASIQLDDTKVTSPIQGIISSRSIDEGELVSSAVPAFTVISTKNIVVEVNVSDKAVLKIHTGQKIPVVIPALEDRAFEGFVKSISPSTDIRTQAYTVRLSINNTDNSIRPGMFARAGLPMENRKNIITVPNEAVVTEEGVQYIYLVVDDKIVKRIVSIGISDEKQTEITDGLTQGDYVVTEGQSFLNDGEKVNIVK